VSVRIYVIHDQFKEIPTDWTERSQEMKKNVTLYPRSLTYIPYWLTVLGDYFIYYIIYFSGPDRLFLD
jgi:hypothetical protein